MVHIKRDKDSEEVGLQVECFYDVALGEHVGLWIWEVFQEVDQWYGGVAAVQKPDKMDLWGFDNAG